VQQQCKLTINAGYLDLPPDIAWGLAYKWEFGNREWDPSPWMGLDLRGLRARAQIGGSCMCTMGTMGIVSP